MQARPTFSRTHLLAVTSALICALTLGACRSYQLGHPTKLPFDNIYIQPAANDSFAPQAQALVSADVREAIIRDGRVKLLSNEEDADVVLLINLTDYERSPGARSNVDTVKAFDFDIILTASVSLYDQNSGQYLFQNETIDARTNAYTENPYAPAGTLNTQTYHIAERQAMPQISREIARKIADRVLSAW